MDAARVLSRRLFGGSSLPKVLNPPKKKSVIGYNKLQESLLTTDSNEARVKVGFHYPSSRPEFTGRVDGPRTRVHFLTPVNSGRELG